MGPNLKNKPLVEAILEVKWRLKQEPGGPPVDPNYRVLVGRFFDRVSKEYPAFETLPTAAMPDQLGPHIVQYRFRSKKDSWPLIQIGPGILTLNDTESYDWQDYERRANWALEKLVESYPNKLEIESLLLRYIDAVQVDFSKEDVLSFLRGKLKVSVAFPLALFETGQVEYVPAAFVLQADFKSKVPKGAVQVKFGMGKVREKDSVVWETLVASGREDLPALPGGFSSWLSSAHAITDDWFFKLIDGELLRRFE